MSTATSTPLNAAQRDWLKKIGPALGAPAGSGAANVENEVQPGLPINSEQYTNQADSRKDNGSFKVHVRTIEVKDVPTTKDPDKQKQVNVPTGVDSDVT